MLLGLFKNIDVFQNYTSFEGFDTSAITFLESLNNIGIRFVYTLPLPRLHLWDFTEYVVAYSASDSAHYSSAIK